VVFDPTPVILIQVQNPFVAGVILYRFMVADHQVNQCIPFISRKERQEGQRRDFVPVAEVPFMVLKERCTIGRADLSLKVRVGLPQVVHDSSFPGKGYVEWKGKMPGELFNGLRYLLRVFQQRKAAVMLAFCQDFVKWFHLFANGITRHS
jgi:hypothetical protein